MMSILNRAKNVNPKNFFPELVALSVILSLSVATPSVAATANFDDLPEGLSGTTITDGGITFSNLVSGERLNPPRFVIAKSDQLEPFFSPPNYLTFGYGSANSESPYFGGFGALTITNGTVGQSVSLDIFSSRTFEQSESEIILQAFLGGSSVASTSITFAEFTPFGPGDELLYTNLSLQGVEFDLLQLYTPDSFFDGVVRIGIDNVTINSSEVIPEPLTILGVATASLGGLLFKKELKKRKKS